MRREELGALTALRFVAAAWVVAYHLPWRTGPLGVVQRAGYAGVPLFFVLSGFVLAYTYPGPVRPRAFWRARAARIVPVYALGLAAAIPQFVFGARTESAGAVVRSAATAVTMTQAWFPTHLQWNYAAWSVSAEAFFYLLFPTVLARLLLVPRRRALRVAAWLWGGTVLAALAFGAVRPIGLESRGALVNLVKFLPLAHLAEFVTGIVAARFFAEMDESPGLGPLALGGCALLIALSGHLPYLALHDALYAPAFAALVLWAAHRRVRAKPLLVLGRASYALYMLHVPLLWLMRRADIALALSVALGTAVLVWRVYEEPMRRALRAPRPAGEDRRGAPDPSPLAQAPAG